jgi:GT2 family glycosyltransferase
MDLSVIIVNYNVKYFLEQCIISVLKSGRNLAVEIIVVDNNSQDGSVSMLKEKFPDVKVIANLNNPGFSIANNQGLEMAVGKYILFLNPDTVVSEDTFSACFSFMENHEDAGAVGVRMIDGSGQFLPESKRGLPTPGVAFYKAIGLHKIFNNSPVFNRYYMGHKGEFETCEIDVLTGAFMWVRKAILDKTGGFDETFFMYGEDIDLSYRITQFGYKIFYFPKTSIIHYKGESTKKGSINYIRHFYKAMIIFASKHFKDGYPFFLRLILLIGVYTSAFFKVISQLFKRTGWAIADSASLLLVILSFKQFWASWYYDNPDYYTSTFYYFNVPVYILTWIGTLFFAGVYDQPYKWSRLYKAMMLGLLLNGLIYGLLDNPLRPSRAIMLMGFIGGSILLTLSRGGWYYIRHGRWPFGSRKILRTAVVATAEEADRIAGISGKWTLSPVEIIGFAGPGPQGTLKHLGHPDNLEDIVKAHGIDEIIFSTDLLPTSEILRVMNKLGPRIKYKVATGGSAGIVGSQDRNTSGELYTFDISYKLALPEYRRMKRAMDIFYSVIFLLGSPLLFWIADSKRNYFNNIIRVLAGKATWIGYIPTSSGRDNLPALPSGVFFVVSDFISYGELNRQNINRDYAMNFHIGMDADQLLKQMFIF